MANRLAEWRIVAEELLEITRHTRRIDGCAALNVNTHHRWHHFFRASGRAWHLLRSRCRGSCLGRHRQRDSAKPKLRASALIANVVFMFLNLDLPDNAKLLCNSDSFYTA